MTLTARTFSPHSLVKIERPVMHQRWEDLTFIHWRYDPDVVRAMLPPQLTLDTFDGAAWIGLVPFVITGLHPRNIPALPWISRFPETNVRTYVLGPDGEPGVFFYTLEASRLPAVTAARLWYKLPYRWAAMQVVKEQQSISYRSRRRAPFGTATTDIQVETAAPVESHDRENFLTARFRLYTVSTGRVASAQIDHEPWPLQHATLTRNRENLVASCGFPAPSGTPLVHYSAGLDVGIGPLRWLSGAPAS